MLGGVIGDIIGSIYEFDNLKSKEFPFFTKRKEFADDSILSIATADCLLSGGDSGFLGLLIILSDNTEVKTNMDSKLNLHRL